MPRKTLATMEGSFPWTPHPNAGKIKSVQFPSTKAERARCILSESESSKANRFSSSFSSKSMSSEDKADKFIELSILDNLRWLPSSGSMSLYSFPVVVDVVNAFGAGVFFYEGC